MIIKIKDPKTSKRNHFLIPYAGNKRSEFKNIYDEFLKLDLTKIKYIIEPFCGTSAMSYYLSLYHPKQYTYILNDNNQHLIELYRIASNEQRLKDLVNKLNDMIVDIDKQKYNVIIKQHTLEAWIIKNKIYQIRAGLFPNSRKMIKSFEYLYNCPIINFLRTENIIFKSVDAIEIIEEYNTEDCFVFIDPPYLTECNYFYYDSKVNIYEYFCKNKINKFKANIILCLSENWIINLLFQDQITKTYEKMYQLSHKCVNHLIISNF